MIATVHAAGASFGGAVGYCLGEERERPDAPPDLEENRDSPEARSWEQGVAELEALRQQADRGREVADRVEWSETVNLATDDPRRAARQMAATVEYAGELKRLGGVGAGGRKLEKPVVHYSLNWAEGETPERGEMRAAVGASLEVLGLGDRQAVMVAHNDGVTPHVHVVVNRISAEDGRAAKLGQDWLKLSRWAESYERSRGRIYCERRVEHNRRRSLGEFVKDRRSEAAGRFRRLPAVEREQMGRSEEGERIKQAIVSSDTGALEEWGGLNEAMGRSIALEKEEEAKRRRERQALDRKHRGEWRELYRKQEGDRARQAEEWQSLGGRVKQWREQGRRWGELAGAIRGKSEVIERWVGRLEQSHREERAGLGREQGREVRELGVLRERRPGYREARFEKIQRSREYVASMSRYDPKSSMWGNRIRLESARKAQDKLEALIGSLPEGDRKELERRDREHPPPVLPQREASPTQEQSWSGPSR